MIKDQVLSAPCMTVNDTYPLYIAITLVANTKMDRNPKPLNPEPQIPNRYTLRTPPHKTHHQNPKNVKNKGIVEYVSLK